MDDRAIVQRLLELVAMQEPDGGQQQQTGAEEEEEEGGEAQPPLEEIGGQSPGSLMIEIDEEALQLYLNSAT